MTNFLLGIDGGGTACRAVLADEHGFVLGRATGGPANIMTDFDGARENIVQVAKAAVIDASPVNTGLDSINCVIGVAGANVGDHSKRLADELPFTDCLIVNDSAIALHGALGADNGIVASIGTGSIFVIQQDGKTRTIGGWGHVVGDQASGVWLGKRLLHDALLCFDGIYPESQLYKDTMAQFNDSAESIVTFAKDATPAEFARFAKPVMDSAADQDSMAQRIVQSAIRDVELILHKMNSTLDLPLCLLGSLGIRYADHLSVQFQNRLLKPKGDAVSGAIALAVKHYGH